MLKKVVYFIVDLLIPQEARVGKLLQLEPLRLMRKLPKPRPIEHSDVTALFDYRDTNVRILVKAMKSRANRDVLSRFAGYLAEELVEVASDATLFEGAEKIILVPMPASTQRRQEKGWNQCELLCLEIAKRIPNIIVAPDILKKVKETKKQAFLERAERLRNVKNSMVAEIDRIVGPKNLLFIIIDDVYTTGATYKEARRALTAAGAKHIKGIFIAH